MPETLYHCPHCDAERLTPEKRKQIEDVMDRIVFTPGA